MVRPDVNIGEVIQMVVGIAKIPASDQRQTEHIVRVALDGLRYHPSGSPVYAARSAGQPR